MLSIHNCLAWLVVAQDRDMIIQELRTAVAEAVGALRPITAAEIADRDIVELPEEDED
jgi:hypothetical protein